MADTCIVCLGDLRSVEEPAAQSEASESGWRQHGTGDDVRDARSALRDTKLTAKSVDADDEIIAHLLPCGHNLHNACLKPWVERANSCPICRATFNQVELSLAVGGEKIDSYGVQDKVQQAVLDPAMIIDGEEQLDWDTTEPCLICERVDESHEPMFCDGCDALVHVFCAGYDEMPEVWHCATCESSLGMTDSAGLRTSSSGRRIRNPRRTRDRRGRGNDAEWARVWQAVSRGLDLDLDFPFTDDTVEQRTEEQHREFARWQRRFEVADRQGHARRLRTIASRLRAPPQPIVRPAPESQEEIRAWNAFEKARESQEAPESIRRKRRRSETPQSAPEPDTTQQRQLKRPRFRPPPQTADHTPVAESSASAAQRAVDEPTFLSSLLLEVEQKPTGASPGASDAIHGSYSPRNSSPARSPSPSGHATPRAASVTPTTQPSSPPLCSTIFPPMSPPGLTFSPFSPTNHARVPANGASHLLQRRGRTREKANHAPNGNIVEKGHEVIEASDGSPNASSPHSALSYSSKEEIQRMVKLALKPRYRDNEVDKDQYTDINRDVSRKMYDLVGNATHLAKEEERAKWQSIAEQEVKRAIADLAPSAAVNVAASAATTG